MIAHLSDSHLTTGPLAAEPAFGLHRALGRVLALDPRPDWVVITGDLVDHGRPDEYEALGTVIGDFPLPLYLVAGNHDHPVHLIEAFGDTPLLGGGRQAHYVVDRTAATVVVLNSYLPGSASGRLGTEQLTWLDEMLAARPDVPAFVCLHHPPIPIGIPFMDEIQREDGAALAAVIARHPQVVRILAGHAHRPIVAGFAGSLLTMAPSTYRQCALYLGAEPLTYVPEPTGFLLHLSTATGYVTHTVQVSHAAAGQGGF